MYHPRECMRVPFFYCTSEIDNIKHLVPVVFCSCFMVYLDLLMLFQAHEDVVEDVAWHLKDDNLFGSVAEGVAGLAKRSEGDASIPNWINDEVNILLLVLAVRCTLLWSILLCK